MDVKVSVIIPVYNVEAYLDECLKSVTSQTLKEIEIICVNDGSTDRSGEILDSWAKTDDRIKVITQENSGAAAARNVGIKEANGEYVLFFDADDFIHNHNCLKIMFEKVKNENADIAVCRCYNLENDKLIENNYSYKSDKFNSTNLLQNFVGWPWDKLINTNLIKRLNLEFQTLRHSNDTFFVYFAMMNANKIITINERLVTHRNNPTSLANTREEKPQELVKALIHLKNELDKIGKFQIYEKTFINYVSSFFSWHFNSLKSELARLKLIIFASDFLKEIKFYGYDKSFFYNQNEFEKFKNNFKISTYNKKSQNPKVSVIIPCYNTAVYLNECMQSVVNQTLEEIEIICVDDGSTDETGAMLDEWAKADGRITVIHKENGGYGKAMNIGLEAATGEYIGIVEPDDYIELDMYEILYSKININKLDFVKANFNKYSPKNKISSILYETFDKKNVYDKIIFPLEHIEVFEGCPCIWSALYSANFLKINNIKFLETSGASFQDTGFWIKVLFSAKVCLYIKDALYYYRVDNSNSSVKDNTKIFAICDEMHSIKNQYSRDIEKLKICNSLLLHKYLWNYERLSKYSQNMFFDTFQSEGLSIIENSEYDERLISKSFINKYKSLCKEANISNADVIQFINGNKIEVPFRKAIHTQNHDDIAVSIIIAVYNAEKYLDKCLNCIMNQTLKNIEIICINDGSLDSSLDILQKYALQNSNMKIINQTNSGAGVARNRATQLSSGKYIGFIDSDDFVDLNYYEELYNASNSGKFDIVATSNCTLIDCNNLKKSKYIGVRKEKYIIQAKEEKKDIFITTGATWNKIYKKSFIIKNNICFGYINSVGEDNCFTIPAIILANAINVINNVEYFYLQHVQSTTKVLKNKKHFQICDIYKSIEKQIDGLNLPVEEKCYWLKQITERRRKDCLLHYTEIQSCLKWEFKQYYKNLFPNDFLFEKIIVSLTSYPARIDTVSQTIECLLNQSYSADKIILWLADSQFPNKEADLPAHLLSLKSEGLEIMWCEDLKSYKKLIPSLKAFPNDVIITVDDDLILENDFIEVLVNAYELDQKSIHTHRAHKIAVEKNKILPYDKWVKEVKNVEPSFTNFLTGSGGCLYPPHSLHNDVFDANKFQDICPHQDDVWFWAMAVLAGTKISVTNKRFPLKYIDGTQENGLWESINKFGENDRAIQNILEEYPQILKKVLNEMSSIGRLDFRNIGSVTNDIRIIDAFPQVNVSTASWIKDNKGKGYYIENDDGILRLNLMCVKNGTLELVLRGICKRDKNGKNIPVKVRYKKLVINDRIVFKGEKVLWHDDFFKINKRVKDGEIVSVEVEWETDKASVTDYRLPQNLTFFEKLFSITNDADDRYKAVRLFGLKFRVKRHKKWAKFTEGKLSGFKKFFGAKDDIFDENRRVVRFFGFQFKRKKSLKSLIIREFDNIKVEFSNNKTLLHQTRMEVAKLTNELKSVKERSERTERGVNEIRTNLKREVAKVESLQKQNQNLLGKFSALKTGLSLKAKLEFDKKNNKEQI